MREFAFGSGNPDPDSFPAEELVEAAARVLPRIGKTLVLYPGTPDPRGHLPLREIAAERYKKNNSQDLPLENIALTNGSMQAISLVCQAYLQPGDTIVVEEYCYVGSLNCFRKFQVNMAGVKVDDDGMDTDDLEVKLRELDAKGIKPKFIYSIATNQNPTGTMMPEPRRRRLVELAKQYDIPVVDDDCYADLLFEGAAPPSLYSYDPERVIYIGSFSKILGPGARLGFFAANEEMRNKVLYWKIDGGTSNLAAYIAAEYFQAHLWDHVEEINDIVKGKLNAVKEQLSRFPHSFLDFSHPKGGLFIWIKLPEDVDPVRLQGLANARGFFYGTGKSFHTKGEDIKYLRLAFAYVSHDDIRDGIPILAECVQQARGIVVAPASAAN
jgi:2-aminoadipate transaminase